MEKLTQQEEEAMLIVWQQGRARFVAITNKAESRSCLTRPLRPSLKIWIARNI